LGIKPYKNKRDKYFNIFSRVLTMGIILTVLFSWFGFPINVFGESESEQQELTPPNILNASVEPTKVQPGDVMLIKAEIQDDYGIESVTADMGGIETIDLELVDGTVYNGIYQAEWLVHDTEPKNYITTITATNVKGLSSSVEVEWSDPTWTTPTAVSNYSSQHDFYVATKSIDDVTDGSSCWWEHHLTHDENEGDYEWYITYDMGNTYAISKIRIFADGNNNDSPCKVAIIKVCDDSACSGESNLLSSDCTFSTTSEWQECSFTETNGRYVYVEGGKYKAACQNKETGDDMSQLWEFDAYCAAAANTAPNVPTISSPANGATGQSLTPDLVFNYSDSDSDTCTKFDLKVDNDSGFGSPEITETDYAGSWASGTAITYSVASGLSYGTKYYWKARVYDGTEWGNWSDGSWDFTIRGPSPPGVSPSGGGFMMF
jgi:hypothetical protein